MGSEFETYFGGNPRDMEIMALAFKRLAQLSNYKTLFDNDWAFYSLGPDAEYLAQ